MAHRWPPRFPIIEHLFDKVTPVDTHCTRCQRRADTEKRRHAPSQLSLIPDSSGRLSYPGDIRRQKPFPGLPQCAKNRCVKVAMKVISIKRPMKASTAATAA